MKIRPISIGSAILLATVTLCGQGKQNYLNFEPPENEALALARIADLPSGSGTSKDYLLVANTTDDSIEIYNAVTHAFLARVPTGQAPIGVYVKPTPVVLNDAGHPATDDQVSNTWTLAYSVNWIGDSVTVIGLRHVQSGSGQILEARAWRTVWVGDEPTSLAFQPEIPGVAYTLPGSPFHEGIVLLHGIGATFDLRDAVTIQDFPGGIPAAIGFEMLNVAQTAAVREGWSIKYRPASLTPPGSDPSFIVLNKRGGNYTTSPAPVMQSNYTQVNPAPDYGVTNINTNPEYDFDIFGPYRPVGGHTTASGQVGGLGSTNFAMTYAPNGDVYVVGQIARNNDVSAAAQMVGGLPKIRTNGEQIHHDMETMASGFTQSMVWRITNIGQPGQQVERLDLNAATTATPKITQPTAVVVQGTGAAGSRIFVTGFNSDSLAMITLASGGLATSSITRVDLRHATQPFPSYNSTTNRLGGRMMGPRSLALLDRAGSPQKLFVLNKVDRSFYALDPNNLPATPLQATRVALLNDPTPDYINAGRAFLYSSALSGNGTSSCASCHIEGIFDGLAWNLSGAPATSTPLVGAFPNAAIKGPMFTQSLKGLPTFEVGSFPGGANGGLTNPGQRLFTTEPLHWRADKGFFEDFNAAFVNLLGMSNTAVTPWVVDNAADPNFNMGLPAPSMDAFRDFTFSMHYSPNPDQPLDRRFSGGIGVDAFGAVPPSQTPTIGTSASGSYGGQLGLELFFQDESESCVQCHALPAGTDNILSEDFANPVDPSIGINGIETAALRGLVAKEKRLMRRGFNPPPSGGLFPSPFLFDVGTPPNPPSVFPNLAPIGAEGAVIGEFGLTHTGYNTIGNASETAKHFVHGFLTTNFGTVERDALTLFMREFDAGVAPGIGFTIMADAIGMADPNVAAGTNAIVALMEDQVRLANVGLAVRARLGGIDRGLRFDYASSLYVEESFLPAGSTPLPPQTRANLFAMVGGANPLGNSLGFFATPLGAERRFANITIQPTSSVVTSNGAVTNITLEPMAPNSAYDRVPTFPNFNPFPQPRGTTDIAPKPQMTRDLAQAFMMFFAQPAAPFFGVPNGSLHQPPRRFRVSGQNILPGARLRLYFATFNDISTITPPTGGAPFAPPTTTPTASTHEYIELPIYPASRNGTTIVHESAAELDPGNVMTFMLGGPQSLLSQWYGGSAIYNAAIRHADTNWLAANFYNTAFFMLSLIQQEQNGFASFAEGVVTQLFADVALAQGSGGVLDPRRFNWYWVEVINSIRATPTSTPQDVISSGGWQTLTMQ